MLPANLLIDETQLASFCKKYGVAKLSLFGSALRDDFDQRRSDVDVLVEFQTGASRSLFKLVEMEQTLGGLFGRRVDLNTPGSLSKYFRDEVVASAEILYDAASKSEVIVLPHIRRNASNQSQNR